MKKTIIENHWQKMVDGTLLRCRVFWHYLPNEKPTIFIQGYNPFPFYAKQGLQTSLEVFNAWMEENGWEQTYHISDIHSKIVIDY